MKIGDLVKYIADTEDFDADFFGEDMFGIVEEIQEQTSDGTRKFGFDGSTAQI